MYKIYIYIYIYKIYIQEDLCKLSNKNLNFVPTRKNF